MDGFLAALVAAAPQLGVAGVLLLVLSLIQRGATQDRVDYRVVLADATRRHAEELNRINRDHGEEIAELKSDIAELRAKLDDVQAALDLEREARRKAEDVAAALRRQGRA